MTDEEIQLKAQSSLQEYDDAVDNVAPNFAELGQKAISALDEFIKHWGDKSYMQPRQHIDASEGGDADLKKYAERLIKWANEEKEKVLAQLSKRGSK
ncbi:MAG TPA: hypothetical protein VJT09_13640 [Pyrinomonadaceae bacterium]|nr:hypothetical protein [Pyrinomonadaceae bacterium]